VKPSKRLLGDKAYDSAELRDDRVATRRDLCNNPRLVFVIPLPPTTGSGEDFQPPHRLRDSTMHRVHSKPNGQNQTEDSQISTSSGRWLQNTAYIEPISLSAYPFWHGERGAVGRSRMPIDRSLRMKISP
jgi:hypothetical protein